MSIPKEVIVYHIIPFLFVEDVVNFCSTCKEYAELEVWDFLLKRDYKKTSRDPKERYKLLRNFLRIGKTEIRFEIKLDSIEDPLYQLLMGRLTDIDEDDNRKEFDSQISKWILSGREISKLDPRHVSWLQDTYTFKEQKEKMENMTDEMQDFVNKHYHLYSNHCFKDFSSQNFKIQSALDDYHIVAQNRHLWDGKPRPYDCPLCNWKKSQPLPLKLDSELEYEPLSESQLEILAQCFE